MAKTAVVTGASSGFGEAIARVLAVSGYQVVIGARRMDRLEAIAAEIGGSAVSLDVTNAESVAAFCAQVDQCHLLVNNAGGALGLDRIEDSDDERWLRMYDMNVVGTVRVTRGLLPALRRTGDAHIVNIGSIAGLQPYDGGSGYTAAKHGLRALTQTLRMELLGEPIRVTEIDPGMAETEFSKVRFDGDDQRAAAVYEGVNALTAGDIAECVRWVATIPSHVNIDQMVVQPRNQYFQRINRH